MAAFRTSGLACPLQQAWDRDHASAARTAAQQTTASWYGQVLAATTAEQRFDVLRADELHFGRPLPMWRPSCAARRARRLFPSSPGRRPDPLGP
ncbi:hypothetical protein MPRG_64160 [Mycobacterium paragordonae]|uniref:Uncharacterized protein n=1 Tax=Mycobacterium paragordonae TaxID=1389713 RepID=A0ABQ1CFX7_9MYCO|nr:hypothetical protein [Mycobacterium paragordonae]GFG83140.1 hypothetical protein MPRG_64160 [Mycobacterium paragordonae]